MLNNVLFEWISYFKNFFDLHNVQQMEMKFENVHKHYVFMKEYIIFRVVNMIHHHGCRMRVSRW